MGSTLVLATAGCRKEEPVERVDLPATPVLTLRSNWAVVRSPFLRVRQEPLPKSEILAHLRRGTVMEVVSKTETRETIDDVTDYWYQVNYEGLRGWVFGSFVEVTDSRTRAEDYARELR
ncbi:MAG: SH3 domain-containing protein [Spirochaetales bacterium]|nr:SH3 domain-containing protein [Spirochaetales bacterium]